MEIYLRHAGWLASFFGSLILVLLAGHVIYNLYFHPLRHFPGDFIDRSSLLGYGIKLLSGKFPHKVLALHDKYGSVVRIAPNELAFLDPEAWKEIYGHKHAAPEMGKSELFYGKTTPKPSILTEMSREMHGKLRKTMSHGFSDRSMREQESLIGSYVDLLIRQLRERTSGSSPGTPGEEEKAVPASQVFDMNQWYNFTTFDIIGDLAFGEPFGCLLKADYHPWITALNESIKTNSKMRLVKYIGLSKLMEPLLNLFKSRRQHMSNTMDKILRRLDHERPVPDFLEGLIKSREKLGLDVEHLQSNASLLIIAGSETTATLLDGITYLLLRNPDKMKRLNEEVRSAFRSEEEITLLSVSRLSYMLACLDEALRCYPPVPIGFPRVVPKGGWEIAGMAVPQDTMVSVWQWAANHSEKHFKKPYEFHPERFLKAPEFANDRLDAVQPFSVGPRNCLGRNLAYAEMRLILARIIYNFDMRLADEDDDWFAQECYTLWYKKPLNLYLTPVSAQREGDVACTAF